MSSCTKIDSKKKDILIVRKGPAEKMHSINFTENNKTLRLNLHYNGANSYFC